MRKPGRRTFWGVIFSVMFLVGATTAQAADIQLPEETIFGVPGENITVPILINNIPNDLQAFGFELTFDGNCLTYDSISKDGTLLSGWSSGFIMANPVDANTVRLAAMDAMSKVDAGTTGTLINFIFTVNNPSCNCSLTLQNLADDLNGRSTGDGTFKEECTGDEQCNDNNSCTQDTCNLGTGQCTNDAAAMNGTACDDSFFCIDDTTCSNGACGGGTLHVCADDGVGCTDASCDEENNKCVYTPVDANCDNGQWCDGAETCDATLDCQPGTAPDCNDGVGCTNDSCNEANDTCLNVADDANCDNAQWCDGAETCDATLDCQAGTAPNCADTVGCTDDSCNETTDSCDNIVNDGNCDDGVGCTNDSCDPVNDCQNVPDDAFCDDGFACTTDSCDPDNDCQNVANDDFCDDGNEKCDICDPEDTEGANADGCVIDIPDCIDFDVPTGMDVMVPDPAIQGFDFSIEFDEVTSAGTATVQENWDFQGNDFPGDPGMFSLCGDYFDVTLTGVAYTGNIMICAPYDPATCPGDNAYLMHYDEVNNDWVALDSTPPGNGQVCALTDTLSPFAVAVSPCVDGDNDGFWDRDGCGTAVDCNDADAAINPDAEEVCDGVDNDCANGIDDGVCDTDGGGTQAADDSGGGGCSVTTVGHNISSGSAMANTLVLLLPLIIFGIRRKRGKENKDKSCN